MKIKKFFKWLIWVALLLSLAASGFYYRYGQPLQDNRTERLVYQYLNQPLPKNLPINYMIVEKNKRILSVYHQEVLLKVYQVALSRVPIGHKVMQGDKKTPEGRYFITAKNKASRYYLSLRISYPNSQDRAYASKLGKSPGGDIMLHGLPNHGLLPEQLHRRIDWTDGCIAVTNSEMKELFDAVQLGTVIDILP